jgi:peptidoglycan hydrolase CwlO-like protein
MEKLFATCLIACALIGLTIAQNQKKENVDSFNTSTWSTSNSSAFSFTDTRDSSDNPFVDMPSTPAIEKLKQELAQMEAELPIFEKENAAAIQQLEKEAAEMQNKTPNDEAENDAQIAKTKREITQLEAELGVFELQVEIKNQKLKDKIALRQKEREGKTGSELTELRGEIQEMRSEIQSSLGELQGKKGEIQGLKGEIQGLKGQRMGQAGELMGKRGEIMGKQGELMGKKGEIMGKRGEIQGEKHQQLVAVILKDFLQDGIITSDKKVIIKFNSKELIVNSVKQSDAIFEKYKAKYIKAGITNWDVYMAVKNGNLNMTIFDENN